MKKVALLEEDDCCFPSQCVTCVFVCYPVLDIMLAFQDYGALTVHGFTIAEVLIPLILTRKEGP